MRARPLAERFWEFVMPAGDCLIWTGCVDRAGYGRINVGGMAIGAHRVSVVLSGRTIPAGFEVDHLCRTPACVAPLHLEPVTPRTNNLRSNAPGAAAVRTNRCAKGHEFTAENTGRTRHGRFCKTCAFNRRQELYYANLGESRRRERAKWALRQQRRVLKGGNDA